MSNTFDISGFKKFIFLEPDRFRIDGLSIWYNSIPIPVDLFDLFFESWRDYFQSYLDHLMVALILEEICASNKNLSFSASSFPDAELVKEHRILLHKKMEKLLQDRPVFSSVAKNLSNILGVEKYEINIQDLLEAASVDGKKYKRLYVPKGLKEAIKESIPGSLEEFAVSNGDMIGNIIADKLKLYRSGFGDALAGLFNKLLDYKVDKCSGFIGKRSQTVLNVSGSKEHGFIVPVIVQRTTDSALWEPIFDGEVKIRINPKHPFYKVITKNSDNSDVIKLLSVMTVLEANCPNDNELKTLETIRSSISRALWISD
jgi:hypothetical protein